MSTAHPTPAWRALQQQADAPQPATAALFAADADRARDFSAEACGLYLDYSKQRLDRNGLALLLRLAAERDLPGWVSRLFAGETLNVTEQRAAGHFALRVPAGVPVHIGGQDVGPAIHAVLERMRQFARQVRSGRWRGYSDRRITDVVNIGIGGSDLGPRMVCAGLRDEASGPNVHFVANVDGTQLVSLLKTLEPATTLFVITSKTFTTQETMANAQAARAWFLGAAEEADIPRHFVAVSTNRAEVERFGIAADNMFEFWDWVGGRYSLWSAVGLPIVLGLGEEAFAELMAGAHAMDQHFATAPPERNLPMLMALMAVWNHNFLGCGSQVIAGYAQRLVQFVLWLQQLEMESNGKSVDRDGQPLPHTSTPPVWGDVGTNSQHAFFQMLHQGTVVHAVDFILPLANRHGPADQQQLLIANCFAQSAALMRGKDAAEVRAELSARGLQGAALEAAIPHRVFAGNRPSNTLLLPQLDARHLGALLALYEHRTFALSVLWGVNAFDQWGVELGKQLAGRVATALSGGSDAGLDASTLSLIARARAAG